MLNASFFLHLNNSVWREAKWKHRGNYTPYPVPVIANERSGIPPYITQILPQKLNLDGINNFYIELADW